MTEELENKLNELLGLKKQLDELTTDKKISDASSVFEEKKKKIKIHFFIWFAAMVVLMLFGLLGVFMNTGKYQIISLFYGLMGFESTVLMKMWYHTVTSKQTILQEMKKSELRIMETLKSLK